MSDVVPTSAYNHRMVDAELDELLGSLSAVSLEGPKGVGKTSTAVRRGGTLIKLDDPATYEVVLAQHSRLTTGVAQIVIDEWQRHPPYWDFVRRAVAEQEWPGRFVLTGSEPPTGKPRHSGYGRIVTLRLRPLTPIE